MTSRKNEIKARIEALTVSQVLSIGKVDVSPVVLHGEISFHVSVPGFHRDFCSVTAEHAATRIARLPESKGLIFLSKE